MHGDTQLTRDQIVKEAESIRLALEKSSSPADRQRLSLRYEELDVLLRNKRQSSAPRLHSQNEEKVKTSTDSPAESSKQVFEQARRMNELNDAASRTPVKLRAMRGFDDLGRLFYEIVTLGAVCATVYFAFFSPNSIPLDDIAGSDSLRLFLPGDEIDGVANLDMMNRNLRGTICSGFIALLGIGKLIHRSIVKAQEQR